MTTPTQRLYESRNRAQSLPHRPGPVDPRDTNGISLATHLATNALPAPQAWATWIGPSQAKIALQHAADAYRAGDHARAGAWLDHAVIVLDTNGIPADAAVHVHLDHLVTVNADRLAAQMPPGPELEALTGQVNDLLARVASYEAAASPDGFDPAELKHVQLAQRMALRGQLDRCPDRLLADALTERIAIADSRAGLLISDPDLGGDGALAPIDALQAYRYGYAATALHSSVDQAAYLERVQEIRQGTHQGEDPGWVRAHTVFTDRDLAAAGQTYQREIERVEAHGTIGTLELDALQADRDRVAAARRDLAAAGRTTTSLRRADIGEARVLPDRVAELGLRALIEHYERERTLDANTYRAQGGLRLRSRVEDYAAAHRLGGSPLVADLGERDWAAGHARSLLQDWRDRALANGPGLDAGHDAMQAIACVHRHTAALTATGQSVTSDRDLPALATAMRRAEDAGYDLTAQLPVLRDQAQLPERHPLRDLHYRLLIDCPDALPPAPGPDRADLPSFPPGDRISQTGLDPPHPLYRITTRGAEVTGAQTAHDQAARPAQRRAARGGPISPPLPPSPSRRSR